MSVIYDHPLGAVHSNEIVAVYGTCLGFDGHNQWPLIEASVVRKA